MKSSVKTQRKVINPPKKPIIGTSNFKVTNSRLVDGKCTNEMAFDSDDDDEDELLEEDIELLISMAKKVGLIDHSGNIRKGPSNKPENIIHIDISLYDKIYEAIQSIPMDLDIQRFIPKYLDMILKKMKDPSGVSTLYEKRGTIWIKPPEPGFVEVNNKADAEELFQPRVCIWIPHHPLFKKKQDYLTCPTCNEKISSIGFTDKFTYRKVMESSDHFYIMTHTYKCSKNDTHVFHGCEEEIVNQLHELSQGGYEVYRMTLNYGASKTLEHIASVYKRNGMTDENIIAAIKNLHSEKIRFLQKMCAHVSGKLK